MIVSVSWDFGSNRSTPRAVPAAPTACAVGVGPFSVEAGASPSDSGIGVVGIVLSSSARAGTAGSSNTAVVSGSASSRGNGPRMRDSSPDSVHGQTEIYVIVANDGNPEK